MLKLVIVGMCAMAATAAEKLIFSDDFDTLNFKVWEHERTMSGGGNWEFEWYVNNRTNSYVRDGVLYIKPTLTEDAIGHDTLTKGSANIWGGNPSDVCTSNAFYGCERNAGASGNYLNPIRSARLRTANSFAFKYGRVEVKAKLPRGDWLWPAIWLLPAHNEYGDWPSSGEIDMVESRGNDPSYTPGGSNKFASTLHWGPNYFYNRYQLTHEEYTHPTSLGEEFHTYGLYWDEKGLYTYIDDPSKKVLNVDFTQESFYQRGGYEKDGLQNPWVGEPNAAPFNREFHLILNLAVGGTNHYFPDGEGNKPYSDSDPKSVNSFYDKKAQWYPTWKGEDAALQVDSVKVWSFDSSSDPKASFFQ